MKAEETITHPISAIFSWKEASNVFELLSQNCTFCAFDAVEF